MKPEPFLANLRIAFVLLACGLAVGQTPQPSAPATEPRMVVLNVRVVDADGHPRTDVGQDSFRVVEDGIPQKISLFSKAELPITYGLAVDCSGSLRSQIEKVAHAGVNIVQSNKVEDEGFLVRFVSSDKIEIVQDITADKRRLLAGLEGLYVEGGRTAVIDAVYLTVERLIKRRVEDKSLRRYALVLISDGDDRGSYYKKEQLFSLLGSADIQIYVIGLKGEMKDKAKEPAKELLTSLATTTGGRVFFPNSNDDLTGIADEIVNDLRVQYVIGYVPSDQKAAEGFHKLQVSIVDGANQEKRAAITRLGYSAPKKD
jgi:Ca-activated chloride channel family protein